MDFSPLMLSQCYRSRTIVPGTKPSLAGVSILPVRLTLLVILFFSWLSNFEHLFVVSQVSLNHVFNRI